MEFGTEDFPIVDPRSPPTAFLYLHSDSSSHKLLRYESAASDDFDGYAAV